MNYINSTHNKETEIQQSSLIAAVFLLREDGAVLLQLRDNIKGLRNAGKWVPPGGGVEQNESLTQCAYRELFEETAYKCDRLNWLASCEDKVKGWPPYSLNMFWTRYDGKQNFRCQEGQDLQFVARNVAENYNVPSNLVGFWDLALQAAKINT